MPSPVTALTATEPWWSATRSLRRLGRQVGLVEHEQLGDAQRVDLAEHACAPRRSGRRGSAALASTTWTRKSASVATSSVLLNASTRPCGQAADEADRVGEQHRLAAGQRQAAGGRVERGEQPVLDQHAGLREAVEQGRLAGVGVADDGDGGQAAAVAALALQVARVGRDPSGRLEAW